MKKVFLLLLFSFLFTLSNQVYAIPHPSDSLIRVLNTATSDSIKYDTYIKLFFQNEFADSSMVVKYLKAYKSFAEKKNNKKELANVFRLYGFYYDDNGLYPQAIKSYETSINYSKEAGDKKGVATSTGNLGLIYGAQGDYDAALLQHVAALKMDEEIKNEMGQAKHLGNIGMSYYYKGEFPKAIHYYLRALQKDEALGDKTGVARHTANIGGVYFELREYEKAKEFYFKALKIEEELGNKREISRHLGNIGMVYNMLLDVDKSLEYSFKSYDMIKESGDKYYIAYALNNIATSYRLAEDIQKSLLYDQQALKIREEIGDQKGIAESNANVGTDYTDLKMYKEAEKYLLLAADVSLSNGYLDMNSEVEQALSVLYQKMKDVPNELLHYKKFIQIRDSIYNVESAKKTLQLQMQYDFDKKTTADSLQMAVDKQLAAAELKQEKIQRYALFAGLILVLFFTFVLFNRFRIIRKQKTIIEQQKEIVEKQKELVEEKQREIIDSIHYAKRIQRSLLPTEKYIDRVMNKLKKKV